MHLTEAGHGARGQIECALDALRTMFADVSDHDLAACLLVFDGLDAVSAACPSRPRGRGSAKSGPRTYAAAASAACAAYAGKAGLFPQMHRGNAVVTTGPGQTSLAVTV